MSYGLCPATEDSEIINILLGPSGRGGGEATAAVEISRDISIPVDIYIGCPEAGRPRLPQGFWYLFYSYEDPYNPMFLCDMLLA